MTNFHSDRTVKAIRKTRECEQCGRFIKVGEPAHYSVGIYYGDFYRNYTHAECHAASLAYAEETGLWGDEFTWFQHADLERDDRLWLLHNHPVVAERLGIDRALLDDDDDEAAP